MRKIAVDQIINTVAELCIQANTNLRSDVYKALKRALSGENHPRARKILQALIENAECARRHKIAICQDTGLAYVFVRLGQEVLITGGDLVKAINKGIDWGYKKGGLRNSVVTHPLKRSGTPHFTPGVVHLEMVKGKGLELTVMPKGFGSENKGLVKIFKPTAGTEAVKEFIVEAVKLAGADACPPFVVGVGIGGGMDQAALLAKKALLRPIDKINPDLLLMKLERQLLAEINQLGLGPSGLGGQTTALAVNILTYPTHIAGLPVAVNISCHALRSASKRL